MIGSLGSWVRHEIDPYAEEGEEDENEKNLEGILVGTVRRDSGVDSRESTSGSLGPSFYDREDNGEYAQWLREYPESICDVLMISQHITHEHDMGSPREMNCSLLEKEGEQMRGIPELRTDKVGFLKKESVHH